jgi:deoxyribose-phosphate aldolase
MKISIGSDHAGFPLKGMLIPHLRAAGHTVSDVGTSSDEAVDYPIYAKKVADEVVSGRSDRGIVIDGAGIGSAIVANKVPGVRAALAYDLSTAINSREHNDANVLTLGAGLIGPTLARQIVEAWLAAECREDRHRRRVALIGEIERRGPTTSRPGEPTSGLEISEEDLQRIAGRLETLISVHAGAAAPPRTAPTPAAPAAVPPRAHPAPARPLLTAAEIARHIDHTLLRPQATEHEIRTLCAEARENRFIAVCVNPAWAPFVAHELFGSGVALCCVVGFPLGASQPEIKALEARRAIREGAREIDMVINVGALLGGDDERVLRDIRAVVEACRDGRAICKVILETAFLDDDEKRRGCRLARRAGAQFVKTSTGFGPGGATVHDVALMAEAVRGSGMGVKAAGGVRSYVDAGEMIAAGATRIGTSAGVKIMQEAREAASLAVAGPIATGGAVGARD